jgi:hypothetical protein
MTLPQIAEKPVSQVEKIATLIGYDHSGRRKINGDLAVLKTKRQINATWFNPITNKSDLMDVELSITGLMIIEGGSYILVKASGFNPEFEEYKNHNNDKFTARAAAVCAVAEQIYDRKHNDQNTD